MSRSWATWPMPDGARHILSRMEVQPNATHVATANGHRSHPRGPWLPCFYIGGNGRDHVKVYPDGSAYFIPAGEELYGPGYREFMAPFRRDEFVDKDGCRFKVFGVQPVRRSDGWWWGICLIPASPVLVTS